MIDLLIEKFNTQERFKNGKLVVGSLNAREYHFLKKSLSDFTKHKYGKLQRARLEYYNYKLNLTIEKVRKMIRYKGKITWYASRGLILPK